MVLDTSAILAILLNEPEIEAFSEAIERDPVRLLSAASLVEAAMDFSRTDIRPVVSLGQQ